MKAVVCIKHGSPGLLQIKEVPKPIVQEDEVLVKIVTTTVTSGDVALRKLTFLQFLLFWPLARFFFGVRKQRKKILGHEFAGIVEAVGNAVNRFAPGDAVFGTTGFNGGAHAEYISCPENSMIALKPVKLSFEQAAALPIGGVSALHLLNKVDVQAGERVLIYGASGSIGTYAVQLARYFQASVTGVCSSSNLELVHSLGAETVLDYTRDDLSNTGESYEVIFDTVGKFSKSKARKLLTKQGRYISTHASPIKETPDHLSLIRELASTGMLKAVIDQTYPLENIRDAHSYVEAGHKKGNVVIRINQEGYENTNPDDRQE
jgi:NADPH:quinone reductase-like Zn-dependent oxidoreductase